MKLKILILIIVVFVSPVVNKVYAQDNAELKKLKYILETENIEILGTKVIGDEKTSNKIEVTVKGNSSNKMSDNKSQPKSLVIDLDKINVPDEDIDENIKKSLIGSTKCGEIASVVISQIDASRDYVVEDDYKYKTGNYEITVLKGFIYDRASIPRILWSVIDKDSLGNVAPLIHDLLYRNGGKLLNNQVLPYKTFTREETDNLFLEIMTKCGVKERTRRNAYRAVRLFAFRAWRG